MRRRHIRASGAFDSGICSGARCTRMQMPESAHQMRDEGGQSTIRRANALAATMTGGFEGYLLGEATPPL